MHHFWLSTSVYDETVSLLLTFANLIAAGGQNHTASKHMLRPVDRFCFFFFFGCVAVQWINRFSIVSGQDIHNSEGEREKNTKKCQQLQICFFVISSWKITCHAAHFNWKPKNIKNCGIDFEIQGNKIDRGNRKIDFTSVKSLKWSQYFKITFQKKKKEKFYFMDFSSLAHFSHVLKNIDLDMTLKKNWTELSALEKKMKWIFH